MKTLIVKTIICLTLLMLLQVSAAEQSAARSKELTAILRILLKPNLDSRSSADNSDLGVSGWHDSTNHIALQQFISKHSNTEEAFQAEVWLSFARVFATNSGTPIDRRRERRSIRIENAAKLESVLVKSTQPETTKMARIQLAIDLFQAGEYDRFDKQANEILARINDYESEKGSQFLLYSKTIQMKPSEIEPNLLAMKVARECYRDNLAAALALAETLRAKFPKWSEQESTDAKIRMLKKGKSPYPKRANLATRPN